MIGCNKTDPMSPDRNIVLVRCQGSIEKMYYIILILADYIMSACDN